jgi:hypothetical protein
MKILFPFFAFVAGPALAHSAPITHGHSADWVVIVGFSVVAAIGLVARPRPLKVCK